MDQTKRWSFVAGEEDIIDVPPLSVENDMEEEDVVRCYAPDGTVWATIPLVEQPGVSVVFPRYNGGYC
jgi:hypothetical protein